MESNTFDCRTQGAEIEQPFRPKSLTQVEHQPTTEQTNLDHETLEAHGVELLQAVAHVAAAVGSQSAVDDHEIVRSEVLRALLASLRPLGQPSVASQVRQGEREQQQGEERTVEKEGSSQRVDDDQHEGVFVMLGRGLC